MLMQNNAFNETRLKPGLIFAGGALSVLVSQLSLKGAFMKQVAQSFASQKLCGFPDRKNRRVRKSRTLGYSLTPEHGQAGGPRARGLYEQTPTLCGIALLPSVLVSEKSLSCPGRRTLVGPESQQERKQAAAPEGFPRRGGEETAGARQRQRRAGALCSKLLLTFL